MYTICFHNLFKAKLKEKWWHQNSECGTIVGDTDSPNLSYQSELSLADLSGIFFLLVFGLLGKFELTQNQPITTSIS